jgi:hypothetical protein
MDSLWFVIGRLYLDLSTELQNHSRDIRTTNLQPPRSPRQRRCLKLATLTRPPTRVDDMNLYSMFIGSFCKLIFDLLSQLVLKVRPPAFVYTRSSPRLLKLSRSVLAEAPRKSQPTSVERQSHIISVDKTSCRDPDHMPVVRQRASFIDLAP